MAFSLTSLPLPAGGAGGKIHSSEFFSGRYTTAVIIVTLLLNPNHSGKVLCNVYPLLAYRITTLLASLRTIQPWLGQIPSFIAGKCFFIWGGESGPLNQRKVTVQLAEYSRLS